MDAKPVQVIVIPSYEDLNHQVQVGNRQLICQPDPPLNRRMNIPQKHLQLQQPGARSGHQLDGSSPRHDLPPVCDGLEQFQICFVAWVAAMTGAPEGMIAIDGKTSRRSGQRNGGTAAIHMVSAFAARQRLVLGQIKVAEKSNEIIAIPKLLDMLAIEGTVVTIDAMGCQRDIAQKIMDKAADYVLALKGNQGSLREDVELFVAEQKAAGYKDMTVSQDQTVDGDHGRIETRTATVIHDVAWLQKRHDWPGLKAVVIVESTREIGDKIEQETRFYITSLALLANLLGPIIRGHWAIESSLHWVMDMIFRDDECRVRTDHAPANFATIKHMAHNLIRNAPDKASLRLKRKAAGWDDDFLASLLAQ
jgi:predicted transposase YbfD/YdcC